MTRPQSFAIVSGFVVALASSFAPASAEACGGFFCSSSGTVNQSAERIIFAKNADGSVTSVVQILYQGPSEKFSWVLPVPSVPQIGISSNTAFQRLQLATNPSYQLTVTVEGSCKQEPIALAASANEDSAGATGSPGGGVNVVAKGNVGPYDYEVIRVNVNDADKATVAVSWLTQNGYDVTQVGPDLLRPYLEQGDLLLAFRLNKKSDAGDIRPVVLTFQDDRPMIPIKLTAVAAQDDMGVLVWVLGEHRSVPINYRDLVLNEAAIDWLSPSRNYNDVVNLAANEAGGQGFVTEYAQAASGLANVVVLAFEKTQWEQIEQKNWSGKTLELVSQLQRFSGWDGAAEALDPYVDPPNQMTLEQWLVCPQCYDVPTIRVEDGPALLAAFRDNVVKPMLDTQALVTSLPYVTRMYTTLSAPEMTVDPEFDYNPDLGDWSNLHRASRIIECNPFVSQFEAPWRVQLADGTMIRGQGTQWPLKLGTDVSASLQIVQQSTAGIGEVVKDNTQPVAEAVLTSNRRVSGCACDASDGGFGGALLLALGVFFLRRRHGSRAH